MWYHWVSFPPQRSRRFLLTQWDVLVFLFLFFFLYEKWGMGPWGHRLCGNPSHGPVRGSQKCSGIKKLVLIKRCKTKHSFSPDVPVFIQYRNLSPSGCIRLKKQWVSTHLQLVLFLVPSISSGKSLGRFRTSRSLALVWITWDLKVWTFLPQSSPRKPVQRKQEEVCMFWPGAYLPDLSRTSFCRAPCYSLDSSDSTLQATLSSNRWSDISLLEFCCGCLDLYLVLLDSGSFISLKHVHGNVYRSRTCSYSRHLGCFLLERSAAAVHLHSRSETCPSH